MIDWRIGIAGVVMAALLLASAADARSNKRRLPGDGNNRVSTTGMRPAVRTEPPAPTAVVLMGKDQPALVALFGPPRVDRQDGPARHVQFANDRCLLDTYLFPPATGRAPVVNFAEAHDHDGRDIDLAVCTATLQSRN